MNKKNLPYYISTGFFMLGILPGAVLDIVQPDAIVEMIEPLGLPLYLLTLIGIWKLLGVIGLARPQFKRINEWAYAGFFFDLTGAAWVHAASDDIPGVFPPLVLLAVLGASYVFRNKMREA